MACAMVSIVHPQATTTIHAKVDAVQTAPANRAARVQSQLGCGL